MKRTISGMKGKGSLSHNRREFVAENVDHERSYRNVIYRDENLREVYHELFDGAVERYNEKQKRKDRRIDDYYEKIRIGRQEKLFHEVVMQIGNKDDMGAMTENGLLEEKILDEYMQEFEKRNPTLRVFGAYLHMDEATPHLHIDFVPYVSGWKGRGMDTKVSLKQALAVLGFQGGSKSKTEQDQWIDSEKEQLAATMARHGIEWEKKNTHEEHLSVLDFKKKERAKEVAELEAKCADCQDELGQLEEQIALAGTEREQMEADTQRVKEEAQKAEQKLLKQQKKINELAPTVQGLERLAAEYSSRPEEWLPEIGTLESAKSYRDKKIKPLLKEIVNVLHSLYVKYRTISNQYDRLETSYNQELSAKERIRNRLDDALMENEQLRSVEMDYQRTKEVLGSAVVESAVRTARQREQALEEQRRATKRKYDRGAR